MSPDRVEPNRVEPYRVEVVPWDGHKHGAQHLADVLNHFADEGWRVISVVPTIAGASARSLLGASASAETSEFAVVLERASQI